MITVNSKLPACDWAKHLLELECSTRDTALHGQSKRDHRRHIVMFQYWFYSECLRPVIAITSASSITVSISSLHYYLDTENIVQRGHM